MAAFLFLWPTDINIKRKNINQFYLNFYKIISIIDVSPPENVIEEILPFKPMQGEEGTGFVQIKYIMGFKIWLLAIKILKAHRCFFKFLFF